MKSRHLLLTNDDGIYAPGIMTLANTLHESGYPVTVVAPDRERSSVGHALTLNRPIRLWEADRGGYDVGIRLFGCDGTPSDCVVLGAETVVPEASFVVSGINRGPNLGDDLTYSGTVSAAMEGLILGKNALAVSLNCTRSEPVHHYATLIRVALAAYRAEHEAYPETLAMLAPEYLPAVPVDPYSFQPFRYVPKGLDLPLTGFNFVDRWDPKSWIPAGTPLLWSVGINDLELVNCVTETSATADGTATNLEEEPRSVTVTDYSLEPANVGTWWIWESPRLVFELRK